MSGKKRDRLLVNAVSPVKKKLYDPDERLKPSSQYDASQCVIHLKPVQNRSQVTHDDATRFHPNA